jgi:hypothetical protein
LRIQKTIFKVLRIQKTIVHTYGRKGKTGFGISGPERPAGDGKSSFFPVRVFSTRAPKRGSEKPNRLALPVHVSSPEKVASWITSRPPD